MKRLVWLQFAIGALTLVFCGVAIFAIYPSLHKAKQAEATQTANAASAKNSLSMVASSTLQRIQLLDAQIQSLTNDEAPYLYFWKGGLNKSSLRPDISLKLATLLNERRFLIGDSSPLFDYSSPLFSYFCDHSWFVIARSAPSAQAVQQELTKLQKGDPRFTTAGTVDSNSPNNPNKGIAIGFFSSRDQALALTREIGVPSFEARSWEGPQRPCSRAEKVY